VANIAEMQAIQVKLDALGNAQQKLESQIEFINETIRGIKAGISAPGAAAPAASVDLSGIEARLLKLEVASNKPAAVENVPEKTKRTRRTKAEIQAAASEAA